MLTDGFWGDEPAMFLQLTAMGLTLAVCAFGGVLILLVAVNEWRVWRRARGGSVDVLIAGDASRLQKSMREAEESVTFDWDWPAA